MPRETILVVEDEEEIQELVRYNLQNEGYRIEVAESGEAALEKLDLMPDLVILDLMLPGMSGLDFCRRLKRNPATNSIPVVMLTAKRAEADIVTGLEMGADDYIPKPFSPRVLVARVRAVLRRAVTEPADEGDTLQRHNVTIHPGRFEVYVDEELVNLTATEFRVLCVLMQRPGWVFTRSQIAQRIHGSDHLTNDRSIDVQMVGLRRKLGSAGRFVETIRGVGYRFKE